jgi:hypothetical protein
VRADVAACSDPDGAAFTEPVNGWNDSHNADKTDNLTQRRADAKKNNYHFKTLRLYAFA